MTPTDHQHPDTVDSPAMTPARARMIFNEAARAEPDPHKRATIELCREYFTNPTFRAWLENETARLLGISE